MGPSATNIYQATGSEARISDLRTALRALGRKPSHFLTSVLILGLGIGVAVAEFAVTNAVLLRPLPILDQDRLVLPRTLDSRGVDLALLAGDLDVLRSASRTMSAITAVAHQGAFATTVVDADRPLVLKAAWVTGNFFDVLGARPALGRFFHADEESTTEPSVVVISYDTWRRYFGADSSAIGRGLRNPYTSRISTIVGVAPAGLDVPRGADYWSPTVYGGGLDVVARLAAGASPVAARDEFLDLMRTQYRVGSNREVRSLAGADVRTLPAAVLGDVRVPLRLLTAAAILLLVLACVNVSTLQLLRLTGRRYEMAVRMCLGANRVAISRLLLFESAVLAAIGGALGYCVSTVLIRGLIVLRPPGLPRVDILGAAPVWIGVAATLIAIVLVGMFPALAPVNRDLAAVVRAEDRGRITRAGRHLQQWFVGFQVAVALMMLSGAALLVRSLSKLDAIDLGYRPDRLSLLTIAVPVTLADADSSFARLLDQLPPALRALPGVTGVTPLEAAPFFGPQIFNAQWEVDGIPESQTRPVRIPIETGGAEYFSTMGIPVLLGRGFRESDRGEAPKVAVVSRGAARLLGIETNPLGRRIRFARDTGGASWRTVVGVVADFHYRALREATPTVVLPASQFFFQGVVAVRASGSLRDMLPAFQRAVREAHPGAIVARSETMDQLLDRERAMPRLSTALLGTFGVVAVVLACLGLYGLIAATVRAERRAIGVRMALGATPGRIGRETLGRVLVVTSGGVGVGLVLAVTGSQLLVSMLYGVAPTDAWALGGATALLLVVSVLAGYVPVRRATLVDPAEVLRSE